MDKSFRRVLIANRGEIALRIIRACREMGLESVAVASDPDRGAPYTRAADDVVEIGGASPSDSYLRPEKILEAARRSRAQAVHPGYGFLSENGAFADRCRREKLVFIGPEGRAMKLLGDKVQARRLAQTANVPIVPGTTSRAALKDAKALARTQGYPILVKAAAGGGGRGMRVVRKASELERAFREAASEAEAAFGDGGLFVEKYIENPRHVEVQILGDEKGNVVHLYERECSIQRRHQKLIEESPAPNLPERTRAGVCDAAVRLARAAGYHSAGTCEFLVAPDGEFYFLEVNARLQVEHPVTEMVTGIDLVQQQIRIAAGEPLDFSQHGVKRRGHAIECRLVAEDPYDQFMPAAGRIEAVRWPSGPGVRVDTALEPGLEITPYYDSLIAKLICWADDRAGAIRRSLRALDELAIVGVPTPVPFLRWALRSKEFRRGEVDVGWMERSWKERPAEADIARAAMLAAALHSIHGNGTRVLRRGERLTAWQAAYDE